MTNKVFRAAMSALGQKLTCAVQTGMSALPPKATLDAECPLRAKSRMVDRRGVDVIVPKAEESIKSTTPIWMYFTNAAHPRRSTACLKLRALSSRATGAAAEAVLLAVRSPYPLSP